MAGEERYILLNSIISANHNCAIVCYRYDQKGGILEYNIPGVKDKWTPWIDKQLTLEEAEKKITDASWDLNQECY